MLPKLPVLDSVLINVYFLRMKWIPINTRREGIHEYHLVEDDQLTMVLKFNPETHSVRINSAANQRVFFLENEGMLTGKYVLKNEYGMPIGHLNSDKWNADGGTINIDANRYTYRINHSAETMISLYDNDHSRMPLNCELTGNFANQFSAGKLLNADTCSLLLGLCWLLAAPAVKTKMYAA